MSDSVSILNLQDADKRLLMKLQQRLLTTPQPTENQTAGQSDAQRFELAFALAPMAFAFLYLLVLSVFIFR